MDWTELIIHTTSAGADAVSLLMMESGSTGTMTEDRADIPDPSKPHGIWELIDPKMLDNMPEDVLVHGWFEPGEAFSRQLKQLFDGLADLKEKYPGYGALTLETKSVPDENWGESWKRFYHPVRAGQHLVIKPSWEAFTPLPGDHVIHLDPGMAFGSGYHDTTCLCLALLEKYQQRGDRVIDVGTGSGILAIGSAMLGAGDVLAIDIDPDAVRVAKQNVEANGVADTVRVQEGNLLDRVGEICDLCVANIIADVIISFASPLRQNIRPGGLFICSGIVRERAEEVRAALREAGYEELDAILTGEWAAFCVRRPG
ncbi:MAG: 50S ribosomal protein L11 methyltransferase [Clostridia bacterium]|nr:50S ribosomal protein L11 methyltransferase [Clostridia bacterium]